MSVALVLNPEDSMPDIGQILYRRHDLFHLFIISLECKSRTQMQSVETQINAASVAAIKRPSGLLEPGFPHETNPFDFLKPIEAGLVSVHQWDRLDPVRIRDLLALVCVQKYFDFRRKDIDEDGNTIKKPGNALTHQKDPADWWKPDDYKAPWEEE